MESDDDFELFPSSPVHEPQLKRLKKAIKVSKPSNDRPSTPPEHSSDFGTVDFEESNIAEVENSSDDNALNTKPDDSGSIENDVSGAMRVLEFDSLAEECERKEVDEFNSQGEAARSTEIEKAREFGDLKTEKLGKKRPSPDSPLGKKRKKKRIDSDGGDERLKESASNKRRADNVRVDMHERQNYLKELRAESQRLLRESRDAAFKPIPPVQKPISSVLDKIRRRKLEILKKCNASIDEHGGMTREDTVDDNPELPCKVEKNGRDDTFHSQIETNNLDESRFGQPNGAAGPNKSGDQNNSSFLDMGPESDIAFRAPIDNTQELFSDSQRSESYDANEETQIKNADSPSDEVSAPSGLAMDLKLDSVPPDDAFSDEDDDNEKENVDPHPHGLERSADLSLPASGDPVKAFVDEEAAEEDDSDNDLERFQDNEEDEDDDTDDIEELKNMITTQYEERPVDRERRDQLHQQWLEQQDAAGMDNLLQKLNCGPKLRRATSIDEEEEYDEGHETDYESDEEAKGVAPSDAVRINLKKVKQMIPQMFTDKDESYLSSEEDETEERLAKQCLYDKTEERATFLSPAEDESSREIFSRIKKLNIVTDAKRKGKTPSFMDTLLIGQNINTSSKSSFLGRASNHSMPSSQRHGLSKVRSFIFGRDDSNSRSSISMSEESLDTFQTGNQTQKTVSAKFKSFTKHKYSTSNSASQKSGTSLLEILRRSSVHAEQSVQNTVVQQSESVFAAFKLAKKPTKTEARA